MIETPEEHVHWNDLLVDSFPPAVKPRTLFPHGRLRLLARTDRHDGSRKQHDHDYFEIVFVRAGCARHRSLYGIKAIQRGDVLLLPAHIWHGYTGCQAFEIYNCCVGTEIFQQHLPFLALDPFWSSFLSTVSVARQSQWEGKFRVSGPRLPEVEASFNLLCKLTQEPFGFQTNYRLLGAFVIMLGQLADSLHSQVQCTITPPTLHPLIQRALDLFEKEINHDWRVPEICERLNHINGPYFIRLFKKNTGITPKAYITRRRIEKAANRLLTTEDHVTEVAIDTGWNDPNLFSRTFRQFFGVSPTEYRAARR
jgi:AraC family L-rhamnose operon transcriptional activator RhaR